MTSMLPSLLMMVFSRTKNSMDGNSIGLPTGSAPSRLTPIAPLLAFSRKDMITMKSAKLTGSDAMALSETSTSLSPAQRTAARWLILNHQSSFPDSFKLNQTALSLMILRSDSPLSEVASQISPATSRSQHLLLLLSSLYSPSDLISHIDIFHLAHK